jgi:hypothetical protein
LKLAIAVGEAIKGKIHGDVANAQMTDASTQEPVIVTNVENRRKSYAEATKRHLPRMRVRFERVMSRIAAPLTLTK